MKFAQDKIEWLEYDLLKPYSHISQATFLRHGGVSGKEFSSLNAGSDVGDNPDHVKVNRDMIRDAIDLPTICYAKQKHGIDVVEITPQNIDRVPEADALFTVMDNIGLAITHADCQAILLYDPEHEAIAAAHAGWKGSVKNILLPLISAMKMRYHSDPNHMIAVISPSLCPKHAEFKQYKKDFPEELWSFQVEPNHFDFWAITRKQLNACGILDQNIECAEVCTYCNDKDYFSHRREKKTGRHATIIGIKQ